MAEKLNKIYTIVTKKAGFKGRLRLAVKTGISLKKGKTIEDSPEIVSRFIESANSILGIDIRDLLLEVDDDRV